MEENDYNELTSKIYKNAIFYMTPTQLAVLIVRLNMLYLTSYKITKENFFEMIKETTEKELQNFADFTNKKRKENNNNESNI